MLARVLFGFLTAFTLVVPAQARDATIRIGGMVESVLSTAAADDLRRGCDAYTERQKRDCVEAVNVLDTMFENARQTGLQAALAGHIADTQKVAFRQDQTLDNARATRQLEAARRALAQFKQNYPLAQDK